jgi:hypothetical protein
VSGLNAFQREVAGSLWKMRDVLRTLRFEETGRAVCRDIAPLNRAASDAQSTATPWGYQLDELSFELPPKPSGIKPVGLKGLEIVLSVAVRSRAARYSLAELIELTINIVLIGEKTNQMSCAAWHIELHDGSKSDYAHPFFHLQHGGTRFDAIATEFGQTIITDAPRITMPPMDAVLAIDFVLSHFFGPVWQDCRLVPGYRAAVAQSQGWLWKPWFSVLAESCDPENAAARGTAVSIFPQLL